MHIYQWHISGLSWILNIFYLLVDIHFLVFVENKLWKYSCRKWYFPFPQFSPWSADWAWKRHKIGHLAGPGESLRRLSATHPKLNPFHLLKLLMNVSSQCIPMEFNTFTDRPYMKTMSYFVPHSTFQKSEFSSSMFPEGGGEIMGKQCVWSLSQIKNVHNCHSGHPWNVYPFRWCLAKSNVTLGIANKFVIQIFNVYLNSFISFN